MITCYVNNCFTDLELSDKIKTIIDNQFDNLTKFYFQKQMAWYITAFVTPHLTLMFTEWEGTAAYIILSIAAIGLIGMLLLEVIAMKVEGFKKYFSQGWNWFDIAINPVYAVFIILKVQTSNDTDSELI